MDLDRERGIMVTVCEEKVIKVQECACVAWSFEKAGEITGPLFVFHGWIFFPLTDF